MVRWSDRRAMIELIEFGGFLEIWPEQKFRVPLKLKLEVSKPLSLRAESLSTHHHVDDVVLSSSFHALLSTLAMDHHGR